MRRNVTELENGVVSYTSSDDLDTLGAIEAHVSMMKMMTKNGHKVSSSTF